jgi:hypothetical protein
MLSSQHEVIPHQLTPLAESHECSDYERDLKQMFMVLFETMLRIKFNQINTYGISHVADFDVIERFTKHEGIAAFRVNGKEENIRALFRGWKSQNPRRGTAFLKFYLQLFFPNQWSVEQLYQNALAVYPNDLSPVKRPNDFKTSRVLVKIAAKSANDAMVLTMIMPSLRSVIPARLVALIRLLNEFEQTLFVSNTFLSSSSTVYSGTLVV